MAAESSADSRHADVDRALDSWRQGDCVLGPYTFVHGKTPDSTISGGAADAEMDLVETPVAGFVLVTQTCDIVRPYLERPYLEVSPLVEVTAEALHVIERGRRPAYALLPLLASQCLMADLDRTMTIEEPIVANWQRTPGWATDAEARAFAAALARKRARFAFPDDFTDLAGRLGDRLVEKHEKRSAEGEALRALREIRVHAAPAWDATSITLMFYFLRGDDDVASQERDWSTLLAAWLRLVPAQGRFVEVYGQVATYDELTASDYRDSDALDLDHLSSRQRKA